MLIEMENHLSLVDVMNSLPTKETLSNQDVVPLKVATVDIYERGGEFIIDLLRELVPVEEIDEQHYLDADFLIYGDFGYRHASFEGVKMFLTAENHKANFRACDYALTHEFEKTSRHHRFPCWAQTALLEPDFKALSIEPRKLMTLDELRSENRRFCNFIYRNHVCKTRNKFFHSLSEYKQVDSAGPLFNNLGYELPKKPKMAKIDFQRGYKFSIAFENESHPGYQTEKLFEALLARTVPIYWGNPDVASEFNPKAFIRYEDFANEKELIDYIREVDQNDELLLSYLNEPIFNEEGKMLRVESEFMEWLKGIVTHPQIERSKADRILYVLSQFWGHALFYHFRRFTRMIRGKK
jgi:hypothetical protein